MNKQIANSWVLMGDVIAIQRIGGDPTGVDLAEYESSYLGVPLHYFEQTIPYSSLLSSLSVKERMYQSIADIVVNGDDNYQSLFDRSFAYQKVFTLTDDKIAWRQVIDAKTEVESRRYDFSYFNAGAMVVTPGLVEYFGERIKSINNLRLIEMPYRVEREESVFIFPTPKMKFVQLGVGFCRQTERDLSIHLCGSITDIYASATPAYVALRFVSPVVLPEIQQNNNSGFDSHSVAQEELVCPFQSTPKTHK